MTKKGIYSQTRQGAAVLVPCTVVEAFLVITSSGRYPSHHIRTKPISSRPYGKYSGRPKEKAVGQAIYSEKETGPLHLLTQRSRSQHVRMFNKE